MQPQPLTVPPLRLVDPEPQDAKSDEVGRVAEFRGLLWCEWYAHSRMLLLFLAGWVLCVWGLSLYGNPVWILLFGAVFAVVAGPAYGGRDTIEGCEEFSLALPPTRAERYLARLFVGGGALLMFTAIDLLALGLDLPQVLAKLYVDSGLVRPLPTMKTGLLYGLVVAAPVAVYSVSFVVASLTHSRTLVLTAPFWGVVTMLAGLRLGFWYEDLVWENLNGYFACPLLGVLALAALVAGYRGYQRKEVGHHSAPLMLPPHWWLWILVFLGGLILALTLSASLARHYPRLFTN